MIKSLRFKFGSGLGKEKLVIKPTSITVFIGPNNSGKSKAISEIFQQCSSGLGINESLIIDDVEFGALDKAQAEQEISIIEKSAPANVITPPGHLLFRNGPHTYQISKDIILRSLIEPNHNSLRQTFSSNYLGPRTLMLNGRNRIDLVNNQQGGDLQDLPQTSFQKLFRDDALRGRLAI